MNQIGYTHVSLLNTKSAIYTTDMAAGSSFTVPSILCIYSTSYKIMQLSGQRLYPLTYLSNTCSQRIRLIVNRWAGGTQAQRSFHRDMLYRGHKIDRTRLKCIDR